MKRLLHIIATPRGDESRTLQVSKAFLEAFLTKHPDWILDELNLGKEQLPSLSQKSVSGKYVLMSGKDLYGSLKETWNEVVQLIEQFKTADFFLISTPMWNFSIPYLLKHYIDLIVQPQYLFRYTKGGKTEGLIRGKKMVVITSRGGQYGGPAREMDYQEPYLRTIFQFVGFEQISFIHAEPMDEGADLRRQRIAEAQERAREMGAHA